MSKIKVIKTAFFKGALHYSGEIINDFNSPKIPSWAVVLIENDKKQAQNKTQKEQGKENKSETKQETEQTKNDEEKDKEYLEKLLAESIEQNIFIENTQQKTVKEQITELEKLLNAAKN